MDCWWKYSRKFFGKKEKVIHFRDYGLFINAGMEFPSCYVNDKPLDTDKSRLSTTGNKDLVTCKNCLRKIK